MGGGSSSSGRSPKSVRENFARLGKKYPLSSEGYIGNGRQKDTVTQHHSKDPMASAKEVFAKLSKGGERVPLDNGKGTSSVFPDGSRVVFRPRSSSDGSPTVEVFSSSPGTSIPDRQKIHFMKEPS